ncbi:unnamed protein product, partial [Prorocentrum cordatum]
WQPCPERLWLPRAAAARAARRADMRLPGRGARPAAAGEPSPTAEQDDATPWKDSWPVENGLAALRPPSKLSKRTAIDEVSTGAVCSELHTGPRTHKAIKRMEAAHNNVAEDDPDDPWHIERRFWKAQRKLNVYNNKMNYRLTHDPDNEPILPVPMDPHGSASGSKTFQTSPLALTNNTRQERATASTGALPRGWRPQDQEALGRKVARAIDRMVKPSGQSRFEEAQKRLDGVSRREGPRFAGSNADQMIKAWSAERCIRHRQEKFVDLRDGLTLRQCLRIDDDVSIEEIIRRSDGELAATTVHGWMSHTDIQKTALAPEKLKERMYQRYSVDSEVVPETSLARQQVDRKKSTDSPPVTHSTLIQRANSRYSIKETERQKKEEREATEVSFEQAVDKFDEWLDRHLRKPS